LPIKERGSYMSDIFLKKFRSEDPSERREAVEGLRGGPENMAIPFLVTALMDQNPGVQQAAIDILIEINTPDVVSSVIPLLRDELSAPLRNMAVEILSRTGARDVESIGRLLREENSDVRRFAADILGAIGDNRSVTALVGALKDENPNVRSSAANSLGMMGGRAAVDPLIEALDTEKEEWVLFSLIEALGKIGDKRVIAHLTHFLEDESETLKIAALEALKRFNVPVVAATLLRLLEQTNDMIRGEVLKILVDMLGVCSGCFPRKSMIENLSGHLLTALVDEDEDVRFSAVKGLGIVKERRAVKGLISILKTLEPLGPEAEEKASLIHDSLREISDEDGLINAVIYHKEETPVPVLELLGDLKSKKGVEHLINIFADADRERKRAIVASLGKIGDADSVDFLIECLESESGYVRSEAANAVAKIGARRAIPCLFMRLERERYEDVRDALLSAIVRIGKQVVYNGLVALTSDQAPEVREMGVKGLGMLADKRAVKRLLAAMNDESPRVRRAASRALSSFKDPHVEEALLIGLTDDNPEVKVASIQGLARIKSEKARDAFLSLTEDADIWVRTQAEEALNEIEDR
jgi:HEAT repeat protein